jgi:hypothetical protein
LSYNDLGLFASDFCLNNNWTAHSNIGLFKELLRPQLSYFFSAVNRRELVGYFRMYLAAQQYFCHHQEMIAVKLSQFYHINKAFYQSINLFLIA